MKQKKLANLLLVLGFLGFLALALCVTLLKPKQGWSYYENRSLARPAALTLDTLLDGTFLDSVEDCLVDHAAGRNTLLKWSTLADLKLLHRPVVNDIVPVGDKLLHFLDYEVPDPQAIAARAETVGEIQLAVKQCVEAYGGRYLYVSLPGQYNYFEADHPWFLNNRHDYIALSRAAFAQAMEERGIALLDVGEAMEAAGKPESFYSTVDHHYTFDGAYFTYRAVLERLEEELGRELEVLTEDRLTFTTLPNPYLGSRSRKLFGLWESRERLTYALPNDPIPFTRTDGGREVEASVYALPGNEWEEVSFGVFMGGDMPQTTLDTGREELPTLLIYGDSFTNPLEGLLYYSFDETHSLDFRYYNEMTLEDYLAALQPDVVVCVRDYGELLSTDFNGSPFVLH